MKLKIKKTVDPSTEGEPKKVKLKVKGKNLDTQYGMYSGIVTEKGTKSNPTEGEAIQNMVDYMKNNRNEQSTHPDGPSNVYRPKFSHLGVNYDRKKKQDNA